MDDEYRLEVVLSVLGQSCLNRRRIDAAPPVAGDTCNCETKPLGDIAPLEREMPALSSQNSISGRKCVHQRSFPSTMARSRINDHRPGGLKHTLKSLQNAPGHPRKRRTAVVDQRTSHRPHDAVGHVGRPRDLQEVLTATLCIRTLHCVVPRDIQVSGRSLLLEQ